MAVQTNEVLAVVVQHIRKEMPDALAKANYLWSLLSNKQAEYVPGGALIQQPIKLIANASKGFISGGAAPINVNITPQLQYMTFNWKFFYTNVSIALDEMTKTVDSPHAVLQYLESKKKGALSDSVRSMTSALHDTATTDVNQFNGFKDIVAASGTAYGGLTNTDYATGAFLPIIDSSASVVAYDTFAKNIQKLKARVQQDGSWGDTKVDTGLMNASTMGAFMAAEQNKQRLVDTNILAAGFDGVRMNGINFYLDDFVPGTQDGSTGDNYLYIFPSSILKMCYRYGLKGKSSPFDGEVRIPNQPVQSNQDYFAGNLVCTNRRLVLNYTTLVA